MRAATLGIAAALLAGCHRTAPAPPLRPPRAAAAPPAGACPPPFGLSPSGACRSASGVPRFSHVFLVVEENEGLDAIVRSGKAPFLGQLIDLGALLTNYHAVAHPSLPNYLALAGGDTFGITSDGEATEPDHQVGPSHDDLGRQLSRAGLGFRAYEEGMPVPCDPVDARLSRYAARHNPFPYFLGMQATPLCEESDVPFASRGGGFLEDLAAGRVPAFSFLTPDVCDDGHDPCGGDPVAHADAWLARIVPPLLASAAYRDHGALFITWDEDDGKGAQNQVPLIVVSPLLRSPGLVSAVRHDHYGLLATIEDAFGLPRLARAATAHPIDDIWR